MIRTSLRSRRGWALVMALLLLMVLGVLIPALVRLAQKDSKDTVSSAKKTTALQLAEAGQDRGAWKLRESDQIWTDATTGVPIPNYDDDTTFTDVPGGSYKIQIGTGPTPGTVMILAKGQTTGQTDVRAIKAVYTKGQVIGALSVNGALQYKPNLDVEWGPVVSFNSITQTPANYYPRKFSAGQIVGRDTVNDSNNGAMPANDWAHYDYAAFYDLGNAPTVDLAYYLNKAKATRMGTILQKGTGSGNASPDTSAGYPSGYYPSSTNPNGVKLQKGTGSGNLSFVCSTCVIYVEGNVNRFPSGTWLNVEALIVTGDSDLNAGGNAYTATIPNNAQDEYQYVPDGVNYWASNGWTNGGTKNLTDVGLHGFMYVGGNITNAGGGGTIVGGLFVNGSITTNTTTVYYDDAIVNGVKVANATIQRTSWDEVRVPW